RATPGQVASAARGGRIAGRSGSPTFSGVAVDPIRGALSAIGAEPHAAAPPDTGGTAGSIRGSRPPATDPAVVRGLALGGRHFPRAIQSYRRAGAPTTGACTVHLPSGVRAALGWSSQRGRLDARPARPQRGGKHRRAGDRRAHAARRSDGADRG